MTSKPSTLNVTSRRSYRRLVGLARRLYRGPRRPGADSRRPAAEGLLLGRTARRLDRRQHEPPQPRRVALADEAVAPVGRSEADRAVLAAAAGTCGPSAARRAWSRGRRSARAATSTGSATGAGAQPRATAATATAMRRRNRIGSHPGGGSPQCQTADGAASPLPRRRSSLGSSPMPAGRAARRMVVAAAPHGRPPPKSPTHRSPHVRHRPRRRAPAPAPQRHHRPARARPTGTARAAPGTRPSTSSRCSSRTRSTPRTWPTLVGVRPRARAGGGDAGHGPRRRAALPGGRDPGQDRAHARRPDRPRPPRGPRAGGDAVDGRDAGRRRVRARGAGRARRTTSASSATRSAAASRGSRAGTGWPPTASSRPRS